MAKLQKASGSLSLKEVNLDEIEMVMPPLREIQIGSRKTAPLNTLDASESSYLAQPRSQAPQTQRDDEVAASNLFGYSENAREII